MLRSLLIAALLLGVALPAQASDDENAISVSLGYGTYAVPDYQPSGGVLSVAYRRGFSDAFSWRVSGGAGLYHGASDLTYSGHATAGIVYLLDVLKYVPYVEVGLGAILIAGRAPQDGEPVGVQISPLLQGAIGLDVLSSRSFSYGVRVEFESLLQETAFFTAGARVTWRWGFF